MHEVVGEIVATNDPRHHVGTVVVGWASAMDGLAEFCLCGGEGLSDYSMESLVPAHAVVLQSLACVLYAVEQIPNVSGEDVAVLGLGPIGLLFAHVLRHSGAGRVRGVDLVDRATLAHNFGVAEFVHSSSRRWAAEIPVTDRPSVVIEAIGHQPGTMLDAVEALAPGGFLYYFGIPDDATIAFPIESFLRKNLRMAAGATKDRRRMLRSADKYLQIYPDLANSYVSHCFGFDIDGISSAFSTACGTGRDRAKVVLAHKD